MAFIYELHKVVSTHKLAGSWLNNLSVNEAIDVAQNCMLWRLMSTFGSKYF